MFTPGKWRLIQYEGSPEYQDAVISNDSSRIIAVIDRSDDEDKANANLIAAAPDMYEALEKLKVAFQGIIDCDPAYWVMVDKALAKAEGK